MHLWFHSGFSNPLWTLLWIAHIYSIPYHDHVDGKLSESFIWASTTQAGDLMTSQRTCWPNVLLISNLVWLLKFSKLREHAPFGGKKRCKCTISTLPNFMTSYASALTVSKYEATFDSYVKMPKLNTVGDRLLNPWNTGLTLFFIEMPNHFCRFHITCSCPILSAAFWCPTNGSKNLLFKGLFFQVYFFVSLMFRVSKNFWLRPALNAYTSYTDAYILPVSTHLHIFE